MQAKRKAVGDKATVEEQVWKKKRRQWELRKGPGPLPSSAAKSYIYR